MVCGGWRAVFTRTVWALRSWLTIGPYSVRTSVVTFGVTSQTTDSYSMSWSYDNISKTGTVYAKHHVSQQLHGNFLFVTVKCSGVLLIICTGHLPPFIFQNTKVWFHTKAQQSRQQTFRGPHCWVITVITVRRTNLVECICLTLLFHRSMCTILQTFTPTPEQAHSCRHTNILIHKPLYWCLLCWVREWMESMWNVWFLGFLWSRHNAVPACASKWSMSIICGLCQRLNLLQGILGISATQRLLLPFLPALLTHSQYYVYTKTWGLDTLHSQRRKKTKMRYR